MPMEVRRRERLFRFLKAEDVPPEQFAHLPVLHRTFFGFYTLANCCALAIWERVNVPEDAKRDRRNPISRRMATMGDESEIAVAESHIRSGGRRLTSNGPFIEAHYHTGNA
jgi:hypothetical protein